MEEESEIFKNQNQIVNENETKCDETKEEEVVAETQKVEELTSTAKTAESAAEIKNPEPTETPSQVTKTTPTRGRPRGSVKSGGGVGGSVTKKKKSESSVEQQPMTTISPNDIAIFSTEFIEHSKSREHESRQLRKELNEYEQQNSVLEKHIEGLKKSTVQTQAEIDFYLKRDDHMRRYMEQIRQAVVDAFRDVDSSLLPSSWQKRLDETNFDEFIKHVIDNNVEQKKEDEATDDGEKKNKIDEFISRVRDIVSKIQFDAEIDL